MTWLLWRQHRMQSYVTATVVALFAVAVWLTGVHMAHVYHDYKVGCLANPTSCSFVGNLFSGYGAIIDTVHITIALPVVLGALGAVIIARELEQSTNVLVWTQGVTRRRWVYSKVATVLIGAVAISAVVSVLVTWWSGTLNALDGNRFEGTQFDTQNITPIAFALFAVCLGLAAGALWRRTLPALATTVGVYAGVRILVSTYVRPHYLKAATAIAPLAGATKSQVPPPGSWILNQYLAAPSGASSGSRLLVPSVCRTADKAGAVACLDRLGFHQVYKYHPASQYWSFQWIEAGIYVALAVALVTVAIVYTLRRDA